MTALTFTIDVPDTQVEELKDVLDKLDIRFNPERQLVAFNESFMDTAVAMGHHTADLIEDINDQLQRGGFTPLIPTDWKEWTLTRRMDFLGFAIRSFDWFDHDTDNSPWRLEETSWQEVVDDNPLIFTGQD